ncbi:MAG: NUDIX domain-containing protein [Clostridia bacterium]|nr:NUDIX domain-containing protein [Clostridia bacterium]
MEIGKDYIGVGCGASIINDKNELLLQKRNKSPEKGYWSIPGGKVEMFETFHEAVKREIKEEISVEIEIIDLLGICDHIISDEKSHWISPSFLCKIIKGEPKIMEPLKHIDMKWFSIEQLPENLTITTQYALEGYKTYKDKKGEKK